MTAKPKALVLRAPGSNCDEETAFAFEQAGGLADRLHINQLLDQPKTIKDYQILCIPGGFSFGDDIAAGKILASKMLGGLADVIGEFHASNKLILGICNGFQVLIKSGFLLPPDQDGFPATLTWNESGRYICRWVHLKSDGDKCVFLKGIENMYLPMAHAEGKIVMRNSNILNYLQSNQQLAIKYCNPNGENGVVPFPFNPNGSESHVAGICDDSGRVFGLMPHPERHIDPMQHPNWTRNGLADVGEGLAIFKNAISFFD